MEVVKLRKKGEKYDAYVKFKNNSIILDDISDCQRSPFSKYDIRYNKGSEKFEVGTLTFEMPKASPLFCKRKSKVAPYVVEKKKTSYQVDIKKLVLFLKENSGEIQPQVIPKTHV